MKNTSPAINIDEILHLAIQASQEKRHDESISLLEQAIKNAPTIAKLYYMLGAEHAEVGLYDQAIIDLQKAVELDTSLDTAHFQLGLLQMTAGKVTEAEKAWAPLDHLGVNHYLCQFKNGLLHLMHNEIDFCIESLGKGVTSNLENPTLNADMRRILQELVILKNPETATINPTSKNKDNISAHVLLSRYRNDKSTEGKNE